MGCRGGRGSGGTIKGIGRDGRNSEMVQVPHRQGSGLGGTGEDVSRGVGCTSAEGADGV